MSFIKYSVCRLLKDKLASLQWVTVPDSDCLCSPLRRLLDGKRVQDKSRWLNSPNVYQKVEILETGSSDPKKITKVEVVTVESLNKKE